MKARDLDNIKLNSSLNSSPVAINTPEVFSRKKKSFKLGQSTPTYARNHANSTENLFNLIK